MTYRRIIKPTRKKEMNSKNHYQPSITSKTILPMPEDATLSKGEKFHNPEVLNQPVVPIFVENGLTENSNTYTNTSNSLILNINKNEKKVIDLEEFQVRQKRMEEQNRIRKELLTKALADR